MSIKQRGEVAITLGGQDYVMVPNFTFIAKVEGQYGSLVKLMRQFGAGEWSVTTLVGIVQIALAGEKKLRSRDVQDAMHEGGVVNFVAPVIDLLTNCLTGGQELDDKPGNGDAAAEAT